MKPEEKTVSTSEPARLGDYELARAKRQLERLLRADGASKREALAEVRKQFSIPERNNSNEHR